MLSEPFSVWVGCIVTLVGAVAGAWVIIRKANSDAGKIKNEAIEGRQTTVIAAVKAVTESWATLSTNYSRHIESLTARMQALEDEKDALIKQYTREIQILEGRLDAADDAMAKAMKIKDDEIATLKARVTELENENARLKLGHGAA